MIKPKLGIKLLSIISSLVFLVSLLFVAVKQSLLTLNFQFLINLIICSLLLSGMSTF